MKPHTVQAFQQKILDFYYASGRNLPWRTTRKPYLIWVAEVMLQQTQVERVIPKYNEWLKLFPQVKDVAQASLAEVLTAWSGLGYNRRARQLLEGAKMVTQSFGAKLPKEETLLLRIPSIGPYTASAIMAFAFNEPVLMIETNIRTVFIKEFFPYNKTDIRDADLKPLIQQTLLLSNPRDWYNALMDYGAYLKQDQNYALKSAHYYRQQPFRGSIRQARGQLLKALTQQTTLTPKALAALDLNKEQLSKVIKDLAREGFIQITPDGEISLAP